MNAEQTLTDEIVVRLERAERVAVRARRAAAGAVAAAAVAVGLALGAAGLWLGDYLGTLWAEHQGPVPVVIDHECTVLDVDTDPWVGTIVDLEMICDETEGLG